MKVKYPEEFQKKVQENFPEKEYVELHRFMKKGNEAVATLLRIYALDDDITIEEILEEKSLEELHSRAKK